MTEKKGSFKRLLSTMLVLCMMAAFVPIVAAEGTSGVYVKYDFDNYADATELQKIYYTDSTGRMEYYGGTSDTSADTVKTYADAYGTYKAAAINITEVGTGYIAYKIKVPKNAKYVVKATYAWRNDGSTMGVDFLTQEDVNKPSYAAKYYDTIWS